MRVPFDSARGRLWLAVLSTVVVFAACSLPGDSLPDSILLSYDKLWHLGCFAVLAVLWQRAGWSALRTLLAGALFGLGIEVWQRVAPIGRFFDLKDLAADVAGVFLGLALVAIVRRWRQDRVAV